MQHHLSPTAHTTSTTHYTRGAAAANLFQSYLVQGELIRKVFREPGNVRPVHHVLVHIGELLKVPKVLFQVRIGLDLYVVAGEIDHDELFQKGHEGIHLHVCLALLEGPRILRRERILEVAGDLFKRI